MRRGLIGLSAFAALVVATSGPVHRLTPVRGGEAQVESKRVEVHVEITFAPDPVPKDRIDLADQLYVATNETRVRAGLRPLRWWRDAVQVAAETQTDRMVAAGRLYHNPDLDRLLYTLRAQTIAENVGMGPSIPALHRAFMRSKAHRVNILDPNLTLAAVWAVEDVDGAIFVTVVFGRPAPRAASPARR